MTETNNTDKPFGNGIAPDYPMIIQNDEHLAAFEVYLRTNALKADANAATPSGRKEIRSRAYAVARHKTGLDEAGKSLGDQFRVKLNAINERRRTIKEKLEALQDDVSRPVDEWEKQDKARTDMVKDILARIDALSIVSIDLASSEIQSRINDLQKMEIEYDAFQEMWDAATNSRSIAIERLKLAFHSIQKQEEERAELDRLRRDSAEREARDEIERARLAKEKADTEARIQHERLERDRIEAARIQAEEAAAHAAREAEKREKELAAAILAEEQRKAAEAIAEMDRQHQAELARMQQERDDVLAREQAKRDEDARRHADQEHRQKIMGEVQDEIERILLISAESVGVLVRAISDGRVPHVKMEF